MLSLVSRASQIRHVGRPTWIGLRCDRPTVVTAGRNITAEDAEGAEERGVDNFWHFNKTSPERERG